MANGKTNPSLKITEFKTGGYMEESRFIREINYPWVIFEHGDYFRALGKTSFCEYVFTGPVGQKAYIVCLLTREIKAEVSIDREEYTEVMNFKTHGNFCDERPIDLTPYFKKSGAVYVRFSDATPEDGWGTLIYRCRYVQMQVPGESESLWKPVDSGWTVTADGETRECEPGRPLTLRPGAMADYAVDVDIPGWWNGHALAFVAAWVESGVTPIARVNGVKTEPAAKYGNRLVVPIPDGQAGQTVNIRLETVVPESGSGGIWKSVRIGFDDLVTFPEPSWTLGDRTVKLMHQYYDGDIVKLNALAGNFMTTLINTKYNLNGFDGGMRFKSQYYSHDSARSIIAMADEEQYSPVVRMDYIRELYKGICAAMVPGSDYEIFMKRDERTKRLRPYAQDESKLEWLIEQDLVEPFANMWVSLTDSAGKKYETGDGLIYEDGISSNKLTRTYTADGGASMIMSAKWHNGMECKPTVATFEAENPGCCTGYEVVIGDIDRRNPYKHRYMAVSTRPDGDIALASDGAEQDLSVPDCGYIFVRTERDRTAAGGFLIVFRRKPDKILAKTEYGGYAEIRLVYNTPSVKAELTLLPIMEFDLCHNWPFTLAENILRDNNYGSNGFDPSYICGNEGLGTAGFAAAAYIFKKYGDPLAGEAEQIAVKAMDAAIEAQSRNCGAAIQFDRIAACEYLVKLGHERFREAAAMWGDISYGKRGAEGQFIWTDDTLWFDTRNPLTMERAYHVTGDAKYMDAVKAYRKTMRYAPDEIHYMDTKYTENIMFHGAAEISYLSWMGDTEACKIVLEFNPSNIDDSGFNACSDLNPYFIGWSLRGFMRKTYKDADMKHIVRAGEYVLYDADGNVEMLNYPTMYINNPNLLDKSE